MQVTYTIPGVPVALQRPRVSYKTQHVYDPQAHIKEAAQSILRFQHHSPCPFEGPLKLTLTFHMPIPKSTPKSRSLHHTPHTKRPDIDNLIKFVLDCCNATIFTDDALVFDLSSSKIYDIVPRTEITIITED
jgi:Holliday junction resolvase RusA-like endonuclease